MPVANSSTWPAAFSGSNSRAHLATSSPIPALPWILQTAPSKTFQAVIYRASPRSYSLPPVDTHHGQGGWSCKDTAPKLQKSCKLCSFKHKKCRLASTKPVWLQADRRHTEVISFDCTFSHICSNVLRASLLCPCMAHPPSTAFKETIFQAGISLNTQWASSMLPDFAYMSIKLFPKETSKSHPLWMICSWAHLPSSRALKLAQPPVAFVEIVPVPCALNHISHVPISWLSNWLQFKVASCWTLTEHPHAATICKHANQAIHHKDIRLATALNELFTNKPAVFKCSQTRMC